MIGILGAGHLGGYLAAGLARSGARVLISPRGRGPALAAEHGLEVAADNADLVARADAVLLAVRPGDAAGAVRDLPWREGQMLVSCCAGVTRDALDARPAEIVRAMPISAAAIGASPTTIFPDRPAARAVLERVGRVIALDSEEAFAAASVAGAVYGWVHALIGATADWGSGAGLAPAISREIAAATFEAAARMVAAEPGRDLDEIIASLATPGGITAAGLDILRERGALEAWCAAADAARDRMHG